MVRAVCRHEGMQVRIVISSAASVYAGVVCRRQRLVGKSRWRCEALGVTHTLTVVNYRSTARHRPARKSLHTPVRLHYLFPAVSRHSDVIDFRFSQKRRKYRRLQDVVLDAASVRMCRTHSSTSGKINPERFAQPLI